MTRNDDQCPACGAAATTAGRFFGRAPVAFWPAGLRFWTFKARPVPVLSPSAPRACTACGLLWLHLDAGALRRLLKEAGTEATRQRFGEGAA